MPKLNTFRCAACQETFETERYQETVDRFLADERRRIRNSIAVMIAILITAIIALGFWLVGWSPV